MKNERGITLVELLAVLALIGIIMTLIMSVFINGANTVERNSVNQKLQQEANYITEAVRLEYLKHPDEITGEEYESEIKLEIDNVDKTLKMNGNVISEGYTYSGVTETIVRVGLSSFTLTIDEGGSSKPFTIETTLSKLQ